jgi:hypothetical protein
MSDNALAAHGAEEPFEIDYRHILQGNDTVDLAGKDLHSLLRHRIDDAFVHGEACPIDLYGSISGYVHNEMMYGMNQELDVLVA